MASRATDLGVLALVLASAAFAKDPPKVELVLKNLGGQRVRLSELRGNNVVLNFWATWCVPCNTEMPLLVEAEKNYGSRGVVFVGASLDDGKTRQHVPEFVRQYQVTFPVWVGATGDNLDDLGMGPAVPATAFIDREGRIVSRVRGQIRAGELEERLAWLAGSQTTPPPPSVKHLSP